jgi:protein gp37
MGQKTKISWTDATWNPLRGCSMAKGSEKGGCLNCYAARLAARGLPGLRSPTTGENFAIIRDSGPRWTGKVELIESMLEKPLRWRKPRKIFVNSMSDLFHESLADGAIDRVFTVMALCPQHTFQVLTKRPERMREYLSRLRFDGYYVRRPGWSNPDPRDGEKLMLVEHWPLRNVHLGVSVEDQKTADERIPEMLRTPAAKRFISYEPALGPIAFKCIADGHGCYFDSLSRKGGIAFMEGVGIDLIIIGGESGPDARPFDIEWARNTIRQCASAGVKCFVKQLGAHPIWNRDEAHLRLRDRKGGDMAEWPKDLRVREFPEVAPLPYSGGAE